MKNLPRKSILLMFVVLGCPAVGLCQITALPLTTPRTPSAPSISAQMDVLTPEVLLENPDVIVVPSPVESTSQLAPQPYQSGYRRIQPRKDIRSPITGHIKSLTVDPLNNWQVIVQFSSGPDYCHGHRLRITETPTTVYVERQTGALPEAPRACGLNLVYRELVGTLNQPLGNRKLVAVQQPEKPADPPSLPSNPPQPVPGTWDLPQRANPQPYMNLRLDQAILRAKLDNKTFRIQRIDSNGFPMTMDLRPNRLNFEVDNGIVTNCTAG